MVPHNTNIYMTKITVLINQLLPTLMLVSYWALEAVQVYSSLKFWSLSELGTLNTLLLKFPYSKQ